MSNKLSKQHFVEYSKIFSAISNYNIDYLYEVYDMAFDALESLPEENGMDSFTIDSYELISYIAGEFIYSTSMLKGESL